MNEAEWLACTDPKGMVEFVDEKASDRKKRLFAVACCRRLWSEIKDPRGQRAVEVAERFADGLANRSEREAAIEAISAARQEDFERALEDAEHEEGPGGGTNLPVVYDPLAAAMICVGTHREDQLAVDIDREYRRVTSRPGRRFKGKITWMPDTEHIPVEGMDNSDLIRELFGNPFRPASLAPSILTWHDGTVVRLAQAAYDERKMPEGHLDNGRLAVLADALEEAGCTDADILGHLRGQGPHVRGCWVVDSLLRRI